MRDKEKIELDIRKLGGWTGYVVKRTWELPNDNMCQLVKKLGKEYKTWSKDYDERVREQEENMNKVLNIINNITKKDN